MSEDNTFGTAGAAEPVSRADFERALRFLNASDVELRDTLLKLAAQLVALTDELVRRIDRVEPQPAPPNTPARPPTGTIEESVAGAMTETLAKIHAADQRHTPRVWLETDQEDKYSVTGPDVPCTELIHICKSRCCRLQFALSTADLDEGVIRWDYGRPYMIRQRASDGKCVHNHPTTHFCTVHAQRPLICRKYDCRNDKRIWLDFENRIPAPDIERHDEEKPFDLMERARQRSQAVFVEDTAVLNAFPEAEPQPGPAPTPGARMYPLRR